MESCEYLPQLNLSPSDLRLPSSQDYRLLGDFRERRRGSSDLSFKIHENLTFYALRA
jgi:hypothetical protein